MHKQLTLRKLISREFLTKKKPFEFLNKMTDQEIEQYNFEVNSVLKTEGIYLGNPGYENRRLIKFQQRDDIYHQLKGKLKK